MASTINAKSTGSGSVETTADASGVLALQTGGVTALTVDANATTTLSSNASQPPLIAKIGGTEKVRIDLSGQLLMGTTAGYDSNATGAITLNANAPDGTVNFKKGIVFSSDGGSDPYVWAHAGITSTGSSGFNGNLVFGTDGSGTQTSTITERMRIDSSGNVNIGQSSAFASSIRTTIKAADTSSQSLALVSAVTSGTGTLQYLVDGSNDVCGYIGINATANTTSYNTSSDYRLKENIVPMTGALNKVAQLNPVFWNWKHAPEIIGQGFIAHELAEVIPDAVSGDKDAVDADGKPIYQGVDTSFLVATLTAAIQEQQTIINDLKARITALEGAK